MIAAWALIVAGGLAALLMSVSIVPSLVSSFVTFPALVQRLIQMVVALTWLALTQFLISIKRDRRTP